MGKKRVKTIWRIFCGVLAAVGMTLAGMLFMALAVVFAGMPDGTLGALNQVLKLVSVCAGTFAAVGRGGERGFVTGAVVGALYMIAGYASYCCLGQMPFSWPTVAGEIALGASVGALCGAVLANVKPPRRRKRTAHTPA